MSAGLEELRTSKVLMISTDSIRRNPENPRLIFDPEKIEILKESIHSVGILVPLIVFPDDERGRYVLLDGERRWKCALELNLKEVPANVISVPTRLQNILRMFNIHNVREAWTITETAWKLQGIIELLREETGGEPTEKQLGVLTGLNPSSIRRCKKLLSFPEKYQKMVHEGEIKSDFLIEMYPVIRGMKKKVPRMYEKLSIKGIIDHFLVMLSDERIPNVTDFRLVKRVLEAEKRGATLGDIQRVMERLFSEKDITFSKLYDESVRPLYDSFDLERKCINIIQNLEAFDLKTLATQQSLIRTFKRLDNIIKRVLKQVEEGQ